MPSGSDAPITRADVEHVAALARLGLDESEIASLVEDLAKILEYAAEVSALDTEGVPPTSHPLPLRNVLRPDTARRGIDRDEVLREAPLSESERFRVPRILGDGA